MYCEAEYITFEPATGEVCGRAVLGECFDCGIGLCSTHLATCDICGRAYCAYCLTEHSEPGELVA